MLVENFGFRVKGRTKQKADDGDGAGTARERSDWGVLFAHILRRRELARQHRCTCGKLRRYRHVGGAAAIDRLKSLMDASTAPRNARWRERYDDIPRAVRSAREKFGKCREQGAGGIRLIRSSAEFVANFEPPEYVVDGVVQRRYVYSVTGSTGAGKTAIRLLLSAHVALERSIGDSGVQRGKVIYFAGENPDMCACAGLRCRSNSDFDSATSTCISSPAPSRFPN